MNNCVKFTVVNILLITEGSDEMAKLLSSVSKKKRKRKKKTNGQTGEDLPDTFRYHTLG